MEELLTTEPGPPKGAKPVNGIAKTIAPPVGAKKKEDTVSEPSSNDGSTQAGLEDSQGPGPKGAKPSGKSTTEDNEYTRYFNAYQEKLGKQYSDKLSKELEPYDQELAAKPDLTNQSAVDEYNRKVNERNAFAEKRSKEIDQEFQTAVTSEFDRVKNQVEGFNKANTEFLTRQQARQGAVDLSNRERNPFVTAWTTASSTLTKDLPSSFYGTKSILGSIANKIDTKIQEGIQGAAKMLQGKNYNPKNVGQSIFDKTQKIGREEVLGNLKKAIDLSDLGTEQKANLTNSLEKVKDGDFVDYLNYIGSAVGQGIGQIPASIGTRGATSLVQEIGSIYIDSVKKIAEEESQKTGKEVTYEDVIMQGKDEVVWPMITGMAAGLLDAYGANKLNPFGKKEILDSFRKRALALGKVVGTETVTEGTQGALENIGASKRDDQTWADVFKEFNWMNVAESALQGGIASLFLGGAGQGITKALNRSPEASVTIQPIKVDTGKLSKRYQPIQPIVSPAQVVSEARTSVKSADDTQGAEAAAEKILETTQGNQQPNITDTAQDEPTSLRGVKYSDIIVGDQRLDDILDENNLTNLEKDKVRDIFSRGVDYFKFDKEGEQRFQEKFANPEDITDVTEALLTGLSAAKESAFNFYNQKNYDNVKDAINYIIQNPNEYSSNVVKAVSKIKQKLNNSSSMSRLYAIDVMKELGIKTQSPNATEGQDQNLQTDGKERNGQGRQEGLLTQETGGWKAGDIIPANYPQPERVIKSIDGDLSETMVKVTFEDGTQGAIQKKKPSPVVEEKSVETKQSTPDQALSKYENDEKYTIDDLVDELESSDNPKIQEAVAKYRADVKEGLEVWGGREDSEARETGFVNEIRKITSPQQQPNPDITTVGDNYVKRDNRWFVKDAEGIERPLISDNPNKTIEEQNTELAQAKELKTQLESETPVKVDLSPTGKSRIAEMEAFSPEGRVRKWLFGGGQLLWNSKSQGEGKPKLRGLKDETGYSNKERQDIKQYVHDTNGVSVEQAAEQLAAQYQDRSPQEYRNAIIEVFSSDPKKWYEQQVRKEARFEEANQISQRIAELETEEKGVKETNQQLYENERRVNYPSKTEGESTPGGTNQEGSASPGSGSQAQVQPRESIRKNGDANKSKQALEELKSKNLTHVPGLGMGQNQAKGTYVSTEDQNRYETEDKKPVKVKVNIQNPFVSEDDVFYDIQREIIQSRFGKNAIENLTETEADLLAEMVTEHFTTEGFDSIYMPQTQEGELIVFDRSKVTIMDEARIEYENAVHESTQTTLQLEFIPDAEFLKTDKPIELREKQKKIRKDLARLNQLIKCR